MHRHPIASGLLAAANLLRYFADFPAANPDRELPAKETVPEATSVTAGQKTEPRPVWSGYVTAKIAAWGAKIEPGAELRHLPSGQTFEVRGEPGQVYLDGMLIPVVSTAIAKVADLVAGSVLTFISPPANCPQTATIQPDQATPQTIDTFALLRSRMEQRAIMDLAPFVAAEDIPEGSRMNLRYDYHDGRIMMYPSPVAGTAQTGTPKPMHPRFEAVSDLERGHAAPMEVAQSAAQSTAEERSLPAAAGSVWKKLGEHDSYRFDGNGMLFFLGANGTGGNIKVATPWYPDTEIRCRTNAPASDTVEEAGFRPLAGMVRIPEPGSGAPPAGAGALQPPAPETPASAHVTASADLEPGKRVLAELGEAAQRAAASSAGPVEPTPVQLDQAFTRLRMKYARELHACYGKPSMHTTHPEVALFLGHLGISGELERATKAIMDLTVAPPSVAPAPPSAGKWIAHPAAFLIETGLLFEINRMVLHPFGLMLVFDQPPGAKGYRMGLRDERQDPEGLAHDEATLLAGSRALDKYVAEHGGIRATRLTHLGFVVQPLPTQTAAEANAVGQAKP